MRNFQKKGRWRGILESKPVLVLFGMLLLFFAWSVLGLFEKMRETAKNEEIAAAKVAQLQAQKEKLSEDINSLQTEEGKERVFRENYGLAKEGESEIVIVEDKNPPAAPPSNSGGFWGFITGWFR